jgi:hypothetical protein
MSINFFFRSPVFPVILDIGKGATCSESPSDLESCLIQYGSSDTSHRTLIDFNYEGFSIIPAKLYVSPLTMKKNYSKKELLQFCGINDPAINQKRLDAYSKEHIFMLILKSITKKG